MFSLSQCDQMFYTVFLRFLKEKNHLYSDIEINLDNIQDNIITFELEMHIVVENQDNLQLEEGENPVAQFQTPSLETAMTTEVPSDYDLEKAIIVAPGEGNQPISILNDLYWEEMAHPHLFPTGKIGYKIKRDIPISTSKYFKQRLLNFSQIFVADTDYIFFAHSVI